jgi:hypothetical protein
MATPSIFDLGDVFQQYNYQRTVTFTNLGNTSVTFHLTNLQHAVTTEPAGSITLAGGGVGTQEVVFNFPVPVTVGTFNRSVTISSTANNTPHTISFGGISHEGPEDGYVQIGTGTTDGRYIPWSPSHRFSYSQVIYYPEELKAGGIVDGNIINSLSFHFTGEGAIQDRITIWMGYTETSFFTSGTSWLPISGLEPVFDGALDIPSEAGWHEIELQEDFIFEAGRNLFIAIHDHTEGAFHANKRTRQTAVSRARSLHLTNDTTNPNPEAPTAGTPRLFIPNIRIGFEDETFPRPRNLRLTEANNAILLMWDAPNQSGRESQANVRFDTESFTSASFSSSTESMSAGGSTFIVAERSGNTRNIRNLTGYMINRNGRVIDMVSSDEETYSDQRVVNQISYIYSIQAVYDVDGENHLSAHTRAMPGRPSGPVLTPPARLREMSSTANSIMLAWDRGAFALNENFEGWNLAEGWQALDMDGDGNNWELSYSYYREGFQSIMSHSMYPDGTSLTPDNWLISPSFEVRENAILSYWVGARQQANFKETYKVLLSKTGTAIGDFEFEVVEEEELTTHEWVRRSFSLGGYVGETVHLAFVHNTATPQSSLMLDGVQVVHPGTTVPTSYHVWRNGVQITPNTPAHTAELFNAQNLPNGTHEFWVEAVYTTGRSNAGNVIYFVVDSFGTVSGRVTNHTGGAGLAGVSVTIGTNPPVTTDAEGNYSIPNVPFGTHPIKATTERFDEYDANVSVNAISVTYNIVMRATDDSDIVDIPLVTALKGTIRIHSILRRELNSEFGVRNSEVRLYILRCIISEGRGYGHC